ncbi:MAG: tetratricopeptide repeat protein, partial [Pseudanabaena sp.]
MYYSQGRYEAAELLYQQALALSQELLGDCHPYVATSLYSLAVLYHQMQRPSEAMTLIQRAIQIYQQTLGNDHPNTQAAMSWLPLIKEKLG